jgi:hypothetical protein
VARAALELPSADRDDLDARCRAGNRRQRAGLRSRSRIRRWLEEMLPGAAPEHADDSWCGKLVSVMSGSDLMATK